MRAAIERYGRCVARDFALGVDTEDEKAAAMADALAVFALAGPMPGEVAAAKLVAHAAGYARAERDVVAFVRKAAETHRAAAEFAGAEAEGVLVDAEALDLAATGIEQGAHRGAAKEGT